MAYATRDTITAKVVSSFDETKSKRLAQILTKLTQHLHEFAREVQLTREEWAFGIDYLYRAGEISDRHRNEFMGLSDMFGLTGVIEFNEASPGSTPVNMLGPFYVADAPELPFNADMKGAFEGAPVLFRGRVVDPQGRPVAGARINMWQTRPDGLYDIQVPNLEAYHFRGWLTANEQGVFQVRTVRPLGYTAPMDGPAGELLIATSRNIWRPAHWHFEILAEGFKPLVTELYPAGGSHLDDDVAFGPRDELIVEEREVTDPVEAHEQGLAAPFRKVEFDFVLTPVSPRADAPLRQAELTA